MSGKKRAFITGVTGQDGSYLAELLLEKDYEVHGFVRRGQERAKDGVICHFGDLTDPASLRQALAESQPDEIYNLGAQSHVHASFREPAYTFISTALPIITILGHVRDEKPTARVYQASSSEMFGASPPPQNEASRFWPRSPYAIAKVAAHQSVTLYRESFSLFAVGGILFNHESERRPASFVTRKITQSVARIYAGRATELVLGNLEAKRDWGFAGDYVRAMWLMLQQDPPRDFVIASGNSHSVRDFVIAAFSAAFELTGRYIAWESVVRTSARYERPSEVPYLLGNATEACRQLGWAPEVNFDALVRRMVEHDLVAEGVSIRRAA